MARETATTRWPKIVQNMIDDVEATFEQSDIPEQIEEGRRIQATLRIMKSEIMQDKPLQCVTFQTLATFLEMADVDPMSLSPLSSDGRPDIQSYNAQLAAFGKITWQNCPWLFAECYLYRCVQTLFARSRFWRNYDIFARQKLSAFLASHAAVEELSERYVSLADAGAFAKTDDEAQRLIFCEMTEIALWGNATDLSLLSSLSLDQIQSLQGKEAIHEGQARIVSNDMPEAWDYLRSRRGGRVDIVLDNAGFELFTDLVYALYLLDSDLASSIKLHVKSMPWFVSDVMPHDMDVLLSALADTTLFPGARHRSVRALTERLSDCYKTGLVSIAEHPFWTTGFDFQAMPAMAPELHKDLLGSSLVIFKGDLNYRKLVRDANWPHTLPFKEAIGPLRGEKDGEGLKILALRTNKADVCVGLSPDTLERVEDEAPGKAWVRNGKYAVISFSDGDYL
ncbi:hypothetical protein NEMBOFW57_003676 [Staphylotrichum longicolle]|uniref:Sugar phosphate phosphatase n=1 Tax=Staphylotrichum longicolle TaxID=669026 RepID=A0AAD4F5Q4_9PEZI|nr:hypothetical protein NEMBOFW57_003676 [Staphylotrichum longicolle]